MAISGTLTANGGTVSLGDGSQSLASQIAVQLTGTFTATVQFEGTVDGTNYVAMLASPVGSTTGATTAAAAGLWRLDTSGLTGARLNCTAYTSGTVVVTARPVLG
jgi:hypothetical protein